jgi:hypothetical protein
LPLTAELHSNIFGALIAVPQIKPCKEFDAGFSTQDTGKSKHRGEKTGQMRKV